MRHCVGLMSDRCYMIGLPTIPVKVRRLQDRLMSSALVCGFDWITCFIVDSYTDAQQTLFGNGDKPP